MKNGPLSRQINQIKNGYKFGISSLNGTYKSLLYLQISTDAKAGVAQSPVNLDIQQAREREVQQKQGDESCLPATMAENNHSWWKLTFLRKKKSTPRVLMLASENPDIYAVVNNENQQEGMLADSGSSGSSEREFNARLEKIVDKNTKGKHVKVSHSGRFKEKQRVRPTLSENPNLFADSERDEK
ncbi:proline-rich protein 15-like protein [Hemicordylus capensis]|uniref:proline-rich protein 15-like protein n=1 Tax=Hemicordylus capensis TaxID=884348 RepID=UPI002304638D|nr:proline-rich protein 15-like protein [Hemicordylus capensis]